MGDGSESDEGNAAMGGGGGAVWVVEGLVRGIIAGSLQLAESSGKTYHIVSHSFSSSFSIKLAVRSACKE